MQHNLAPESGHVALRPVTYADAGFILSLRCDPRLNSYINETEPDLAAQQDWLKRYEQRPGDYYFIITERGRPRGTIAIYDADQDAAEWGRWIVTPGSLAAVGSVMLAFQVAFERLDLQRLYSRTVAENKSVISFHDSMGARRRCVRPGYATIRGRRLDSIEHEIDRPLWEAIRPRLQALVQRLATVRPALADA